MLAPTQEYGKALGTLSLDFLQDRRLKVTHKFESKMANNPKFGHLFPKKDNNKTRSKQKYIEPRWKTKRLGNSAIPFFTCQLNGEKAHK